MYDNERMDDMLHKKNVRHVKMLHQFTLTTTMLLTGALVYHEANDHVYADTNPAIQEGTNQTLKQQLEEAERHINDLKHLNTDYKQSFLELAQLQHDSKSGINSILDKADHADELAQASATQENKRPIVDEIDQMIEKLNEKVDTYQRGSSTAKNTSNHNTTRHDHRTDTNTDVTKVLDDIDSLSHVIGNEGETSESQVDEATGNTENREATQNEGASSEVGVVEAPSKDKSHHTMIDDIFKTTDASSQSSLLSADRTTQKIDDIVSDNANRHSRNDSYYASKSQALKQLKETFQKNENVSDAQKKQIDQSVQNVQSQLDQQNNAILTQLSESNHKRQATEDVLGQLFSDAESKKIANQMAISGQSDQHIADQIQRAMGQLRDTSSDTLLDGMLNNTSDQKQLVKSLLASRFDRGDATALADRIMQDNPTNDVIIERLKQNFNSNGQATSDDILNALLNNTDRKKEVVEAILGAKLNPENARILAEDIAKDIKNANDLLGLVRGELNDKANHLLALRHEIAQAREDAQKRLDWIIAPLKGLPDLNLDQGLSDLSLPSPSTNDRYRHLMNNGGSGLKDKLGGGLFQHDFASKPHIDPNQLIGKNTSGGILDGLFDDKGNLSLPDTGTVAKRALLPVGIMIIALGACLIWKFRKKRK